MAALYSLFDFTCARAKVEREPATLTERDICILREFGGDALVARATDARWKALQASREPSPEPLEPKAATTTPKAPLRDVIAEVMVETVKQAMAPRDAKIATLEELVRDIPAMRERIASLEVRCLELEAVNATANPDHVPR